MNTHKIKYWLSVGAEPTRAVQRVLHRFSEDLWPKPVVPLGSEQMYEKPEKTYFIHHYRDYFKKSRHEKYKYHQMLQEEMNMIERRKRIQAEAVAHFGVGANEQDISLVKTDDFDSEEADIFQRVKTFKELRQRFEKHLAEKRNLRGNDLRYNVYLKKMNKLTRTDIGLDVEAYKDFCNNLKEFAPYNDDFDILNEDTTQLGTSQFGPLSTLANEDFSFSPNDEQLYKMRVLKKNKEKLDQLRTTVGKLYRDYHIPIYQHDHDIVDAFEKDPSLFLDFDGNLAIDIKRLYDKRKEQIKERSQMGVLHIETITPKDLEQAGVSKREFQVIKKLMKMDKDIFVHRTYMTHSESPFLFNVDLSKYESIDVPHDCKEIIYRP